MTPLTFWYAHDQGSGLLATTPAEIDAALDHIAALTDDIGIVATIALADTEDQVLYAGFKGDVGTLYYATVGEGHFSHNQTSDGDTVLSYALQQNEMEFPPDAELPITDIRAAVHDYAHTGTRPTTVHWQQWTPPHTPNDDITDDDPTWG